MFRSKGACEQRRIEPGRGGVGAYISQSERVNERERALHSLTHMPAGRPAGRSSTRRAAPLTCGRKTLKDTTDTRDTEDTKDEQISHNRQREQDNHNHHQKP